VAKQQEIAGFEAPKNADIDNAIDQWIESKDEQKYATERTKLRHAALLLHMQNAGIDAYPFVDPKTGKKKQIVIAREPKAKATKAPRWNRHDDDADIGDEIEVVDDQSAEPAVDNVVEMRRVKRSSVEKEIDPFAATRGALDEAATDPGAELDAIGGSYAAKLDEVFPDKPEKRKGRKSK